MHERHLAGWAITALWAIIANEPAAHACMPHFDFIMTEKERQEAPARCDRGEAQGCVIAFEDRHASDRSAVQWLRTQRACAHGHVAACRYILERAAPKDDEPSIYTKEYQKDELKVLGPPIVEVDPLPPDALAGGVDLALVTIRKACAERDAQACRVVTTHSLFTEDEVRRVEDGACLLGLGQCEGVAITYRDGDLACLDYRCWYMHDPDACLRLCEHADPNACATVEHARTNQRARAITRALSARCRTRDDAAACVSVWALNGAHECSRPRVPKDLLAMGIAALAKACSLGVPGLECDAAKE